MIEIEGCPISNRMNELFSVIMYLLTPIALGLGFYLFYIKLTAFPFILLGSLLYGFGCLGLKGM